MRAELTATFVGGLLKPDEQLVLPDQTRVKLTIESLDGPADAAVALASLIARMEKRPVHGGGKRFTRDEMHERR
jgi:hypothetical protein